MEAKSLESPAAGKSIEVFLNDFIDAHREREWFVLEIDLAAHFIKPDEILSFMTQACRVFRGLGYQIDRLTKVLQVPEGGCPFRNSRETYLFKKPSLKLPTDYLLAAERICDG